MKNALIGLILAVALIGVFSDDFPSNSVNTKNSELFSYLPSEFPKLSALFSVDSHHTLNQKNAIDALKKIIGYLPLAEQNVFSSALVGTLTGEKLFDYNTYLNYIGQILVKEKEALIEYINQNSKRLPKGLGCIMKVVNTFSRDSFEDKELLNSIYTNIDNVLQAQENVAQCSINFLNTLFDDGLERRELLLVETKLSGGKIDNTNKLFLTDNKDELYTIKYPSNPSAPTVTAFKKFASCHQYYNNEITRNIIEAEISIGQLKKCFNENEYNPDAGKSSDKVFSSINYHKKKIIGINDGNGTRSDQRTQTNHTLNYGFNLGKKSISFTGDNKQSTLHIGFLNEEWKTSIGAIDSTLINKIQSKIPFANLHNLLITFCSTTTPINAGCIKEFENNKTINSCTGMDLTKYDSCSSEKLSITQGLIEIYNNALLYSEATINGKQYYDIYLNGKSIGQEFAETSTACISSFGSGGKNDKDACRDVMKTKCGNEIDFRCKQSSLYDILNEMPISSYQLPPACLGYVSVTSPTTSDAEDEACLNWINEKFMLGGIIPKPSAFISYSLIAQADANLYRYAPTEYENKYNIDYTLLGSQSLTASTHLSVGATSAKPINTIEFKHAMDATYTIMEDSSNYYSTSSFLLCLIFLIFF